MKKYFKWIRLLFTSVLGTGHLILMFVFLLSAYSDHVSPEHSVLFSYLGLGFPVLCIANGGLVLYWLCTRRWRFFLIGLGSFLLAASAVTRYYPMRHAIEQNVEDTVLKVLTYNIMGFAYKDPAKPEVHPILKYIADSDADIVCLQEYITSQSDKNLTDKKIRQTLKKYPHHITHQCGPQGASMSIAIFSKFPIRQSKKIPYESLANGSVRYDLEVNGKKLVVINNHLESFKLTSKDKVHYEAFLKNMNATTYEDFKSSVQQKLGPAFCARAAQAQAVAQEIATVDPNDYLVVCGDFNDTPISYAYHTIRGPLKDAYAAVGRGPGVTYHENFFLFRIDNILHSSNMQALQVHVDHVPYSDHYPLWSILRLNKR